MFVSFNDHFLSHQINEAFFMASISCFTYIFGCMLDASCLMTFTGFQCGTCMMERISIFFLGILFLALCFRASMAETKGYVKYKDPKQPLGARMKDLLNKMTLEEKIGQMVQIERLNATADVMKNYLIGIYIYA